MRAVLCASLLTSSLEGRNQSDSLCDQLRQQISPSVLCADAGDNIASSYNFDSFNPRCADLVPDYVVEVHKAEDVQWAIKLAQDFNMPFSVRGGGHSYVCNGFKKGSVHLDMRPWRDGFEYREDGNYAYVTLRPGHLLRDLQENLPLSHEFAMGTCPSVGAFGFYLHGGSSPRVDFLGNSTIHNLTVVTADYRERALHSKSQGDEADLWEAMRQAGSSFGVVTSMTLRLQNNPERISFLIPVTGNYQDLSSIIFNDDVVKHSETLGIWAGLFRWSTFSGPLWYLKIAMRLDWSTCKWKDLINTADCKTMCKGCHSEEAALLKDELASYFSIHLSSRDITAEPLQALANWMTYRGFSFHRDAAAALPDTQSAEPPPVLPPGVPVPWPAHSDSGSIGRFVSPQLAKQQSDAWGHFLEDDPNHMNQCWLDLGPIKGETADVFMDITCFDTGSIANLLDFENLVLNANYPGSRRYYNLPVWTNDKKARFEYFPNYDRLMDIKKYWDPQDIFNIPDGIHPPGKSWPSQDPFASQSLLV